jgi:hypothetical protein
MHNDLTGAKFNYLTIIKRVDNLNGNIMWLCRCDCGTEKIIRGSHITNHKTLSCGCYKDKNTSIRNTTHGKSNTRIYKSWAHMVARCNNPNDNAYKHYGGRGITVCDEWTTFEGFYKDMGSSYRDGLTIDRINNNGNYEPSNCKWSTYEEQGNNKRNNHIIEYNGISKSIAQWEKELGYPKDLISAILRRKWSVDRAISTPYIKR